jgi:hypothetical protein
MLSMRIIRNDDDRSDIRKNSCESSRSCDGSLSHETLTNTPQRHILLTVSEFR